MWGKRMANGKGGGKRKSVILLCLWSSWGAVCRGRGDGNGDTEMLAAKPLRCRPEPCAERREWWQRGWQQPGSRAIPCPWGLNPPGTRQGELCVSSAGKPGAVSIPSSDVTSRKFPQKWLLWVTRPGKQPRIEGAGEGREREMLQEE